MTNRTEQIKIDLYEEVSNPLDGVEEIMMNNDWVYDRLADDEMTVTISSEQGHHTLRFLWQDEFSAMQLSCMPDITVSPDKRDIAAQTLQSINSNLWLGHFDLQRDAEGSSDLMICFRHTSLFRGNVESSGVEHMEDVIDIAIAECERYYMTLDLLSRTESHDNKTLTLAMMETMGQS